MKGTDALASGSLKSQVNECNPQLTPVRLGSAPKKEAYLLNKFKERQGVRSASCLHVWAHLRMVTYCFSDVARLPVSAISIAAVSKCIDAHPLSLCSTECTQCCRVVVMARSTPYDLHIVAWPPESRTAGEFRPQGTKAATKAVRAVLKESWHGAVTTYRLCLPTCLPPSHISMIAAAGYRAAANSALLYCYRYSAAGASVTDFNQPSEPHTFAYPFRFHTSAQQREQVAEPAADAVLIDCNEHHAEEAVVKGVAPLFELHVLACFLWSHTTVGEQQLGTAATLTAAMLYWCILCSGGRGDEAFTTLRAIRPWLLFKVHTPEELQQHGPAAATQALLLHCCVRSPGKVMMTGFPLF
ncbi:unnamed protein product [Rangifer tarandus platyrhynchus]|uniref:Uncharacterized protein n=1 Tax=Rangifer tarandus platyrhynchus TaxID=3082113 RepID=A0ABN8XJD7_RANTA|nr:unnamed protein product [Rangifer tarandus platyrhynchus]